MDQKLSASRTGSATATHGGYANTGVHIGDVVRPAEPARSRYEKQVEQIAPAELFHRQTELAELHEFCTAEHAKSYRWWRAPKWAGKTALMGWFVLNPPPGIKIVSFFVTARYAGQDNRDAFIGVVLEQLAALLGEPIPAFLTDANRQPHLLGMLDEAALLCQQREERLVLVVDGLDEDRGVTGPESHSIAALLPARPSHGMRVIVAGRPNPPVPGDVGRDHPLRNPDIVRPLEASQFAAVVRDDMERELHRLLEGTQTQQNLLGLLTAARGGLSGQDLLELTGLPEWQVRRQLRTVAGRSFDARPSQWQPDTQPGAYLLGHEDLQTTAVEFLGHQRLDAYRQKIHEWASHYRDQRWPVGTPEYLLRGYFRMLQLTGDTTRMIACATDPARHNRMLDMSGGDSAALAEIAIAQDIILNQPDPDVPNMVRLAMHRYRLADRNANIPTRLPAWLNQRRREQLAPVISALW